MLTKITGDKRSCDSSQSSIFSRYSSCMRRFSSAMHRCFRWLFGNRNRSQFTLEMRTIQPEDDRSVNSQVPPLRSTAPRRSRLNRLDSVGCCDIFIVMFSLFSLFFGIFLLLHVIISIKYFKHDLKTELVKGSSGCALYLCSIFNIIKCKKRACIALFCVLTLVVLFVFLLKGLNNWYKYGIDEMFIFFLTIIVFLIWIIIFGTALCSKKQSDKEKTAMTSTDNNRPSGPRNGKDEDGDGHSGNNQYGSESFVQYETAL